jgi:DNA-directed RNA polymerase subunit RPC12/RpoP
MRFKPATDLPGHRRSRIELTADEMRRLQDEMIGICQDCGAEREETEDDARDYGCNECGAHRVMGSGEWLIEDRIDMID